MRILRLVIDDVWDVVAGVGSRQGRTVLLMSSVALSAGALVASMGVGQTAAAQIGADLAGAIRNEVTVFGSPQGIQEAESEGVPLFPLDAEDRALHLPMVEAAGMRIDVDAHLAPRRFADAEPVTDVQVMGATAGYLRAIESSAGYASWAFAPESSEHVALVGTGAAERLGIGSALGYTGFNIWLGEDKYQVVGVALADQRLLEDVIIIPYQLAAAIQGGDTSARLVVRAAQGAGAGVATVIRAAIRPEAPGTLTATRVTDFADLRRGVESQLGRLLGAAGGLLLVITGLLIASSMAASVVSRTAEIGLRRALGASRAAILRLFLLEGGFIGLLGGLAGAALGGWGVVGTALVNEWSVELPAWFLLAGAGMGLGIGLAASGYPAVRAARISPASAVRVE